MRKHAYRLAPLLLLSSLLSGAAADVQVTFPSAGTSLTADTPFTITWQDSGNAPALSTLSNYVINLCAGGDNANDFVCSLGVLKAGGAFADGNSAAAPGVAPSVGGSGVNA